MKAINTLYSGNYFRSRTEARWAVYFDLIGVKWEYEKEGYDLGDGVKYLPDFWFPEHKMYGEVKATGILLDHEEDKAHRLSIQSELDVVILSGQPHCKPCLVFYQGGQKTEGVPFIEELVGEYGRIFYGEYKIEDGELGAVAAMTARMARFEHGEDTSKRSRMRMLNHYQEQDFIRSVVKAVKEFRNMEILDMMEKASPGWVNRLREKHMDELFGKRPSSTLLRPRQPVRIKRIEQ
jgi:hypothetical protein